MTRLWVLETVIITVLFHSSDLDPVQAPHWSVRVRKADNPQCLLGKAHHVSFLNVTYLPIFQIGTLKTFFILYSTYSNYCLSFLWPPQLALTYRKSLYQLQWIFLVTAIAGFLSLRNPYFNIFYHILMYYFAFLMYYVTFSSGTVCVFSWVLFVFWCSSGPVM